MSGANLTTGARHCCDSLAYELPDAVIKRVEVAQQLFEHHRLLVPDYGGFDIYDGEYEVRDPEVGAAANADGVAASNGQEICVACGQQLLNVMLTIEVWDGPAEPPQAWDGNRKFVLNCPSGVLVVSERTVGASEVTIPSETGNHHARLWYRGRDDAKRAASALVGRSTGQQRRQHDGAEQYLLQLWHQ